MNNTGIGCTPIIEIYNSPTIYAKLEGQNIFGSAKDRAAYYIIEHLINSNRINRNTKIVESSSGNFAIALAGVCKKFGLKFICVVDPLLNETNFDILLCLGAEIIVVKEPDENNNYLQTRLKKVAEILDNNTDVYWINQYDNPLIPNAYYSLAEEIFIQVPKTNYIFVPVSTCGTISGISQYTKEHHPDTKIIAVDLDCSNIFFKSETKQHIPGMGLFKQPGNLASAIIDDVVIVSEKECINECHQLIDYGLFVGASSGGTMAAIKKYFHHFSLDSSIVAIMPDKGERYLKSVYCEKWIHENYKNI